MFLLLRLPNPNIALLVPAFRRRRRETVVRNMISSFVCKQTTGFVSFYGSKTPYFFSKIRVLLKLCDTLSSSRSSADFAK